METCIIGCDQGVDLRAGPGSVPDGHGCDPGHGTGTAITVAAIAERTALEGITKMKLEGSHEDEVQIDRQFVGVIVRRIDECSGSRGSDCAPGQTHPFGPA
jgi:hypothetical protein